MMTTIEEYFKTAVLRKNREGLDVEVTINRYSRNMFTIDIDGIVVAAGHHLSVGEKVTITIPKLRLVEDE